MDDMFSFVKERLVAMKGKRAAFARASGVSYETLRNIVENAVVSPGINTLQPLYDQLRAMEAPPKPKPKRKVRKRK